MKKSLIFFSILLCSYSLFSQHYTHDQDLVILNDGSQFIGELVEYKPDSFLILQTKMKAPLHFNIEQVDRVLQGYSVLDKISVPYEYGKQYYQLEIGSPISSDGGFGMELSVSGIHQHSSKVGIGIGASYVNYRNGDYYSIGISRLPVFLIYRAYLREGKVVPYIQLNTGYAINPSEDNYKSGLHLNPKFGLRFAQNGCMFQVFLGAHFTKSNSDFFENTWDDGGWQEKRTIQRTTVGLGISF